MMTKSDEIPSLPCGIYSTRSFGNIVKHSSVDASQMNKSERSNLVL